MMLEAILITNLMALVGLGIGWTYSTWFYNKEKQSLADQVEKRVLALLKDPDNMAAMMGTIEKTIVKKVGGMIGGWMSSMNKVATTMKEDLTDQGLMGAMAQVLPKTSAIVEQDKGTMKMMGMLKLIPQLMQGLQMFKQMRNQIPQDLAPAKVAKAIMTPPEVVPNGMEVPKV